MLVAETRISISKSKIYDQVSLWKYTYLKVKTFVNDFSWYRENVLNTIIQNYKPEYEELYVLVIFYAAAK